MRSYRDLHPVHSFDYKSYRHIRWELAGERHCRGLARGGVCEWVALNLIRELESCWRRRMRTGLWVSGHWMDTVELSCNPRVRGEETEVKALSEEIIGGAFPRSRRALVTVR
jgi:hypothetical protein